MRRSIYLAARYDDASIIRVWRGVLRASGHTIVSSWVDHPPASTDQQRRERAEKFLLEIRSATTLVLKNTPAHFGEGYGGKHVELGYALALNKDIFVIGGRENCFHHLGHIVHCDSLLDLLFRIGREPYGQAS